MFKKAHLLLHANLLLGALLMTSCHEERVDTVHIIVPDGYKGLIKIVRDRSAGVVPYENGEIVYSVPTNGVLRVKESKALAKWHETIANFADGTSIPVNPRNTTTIGIALYEIGSSSSGKTFWFVGTEAEKKEAMKDSFHLLR